MRFDSHNVSANISLFLSNVQARSFTLHDHNPNTILHGTFVLLSVTFLLKVAGVFDCMMIFFVSVPALRVVTDSAFARSFSLDDFNPCLLTLAKTNGARIIL